MAPRNPGTKESRQLKRFHAYLRDRWKPGINIAGMLYDPPKVLKKVAPLAYASAFEFWQTNMCHSCHKVDKSFHNFADMHLCDYCYKKYNDAADALAEIRGSI